MFNLFKKGKSSSKEKLPPSFIEEYSHLLKLENNTIKRFEISQGDFYPCLNDKTTNTHFDRHYVYHPAWAARILKEINPKKHVDISSTLHFCSIISAFIPTDFYDYRPAGLLLDNLNSLAADLNKLPFDTNSVESISCMHTVEHVGLGRYGDPIDYDGDIKAIKELKRVVAPGGSLLFVVPLGYVSKIFFNAHRVYDKYHVFNLFQGFDLKQFALIPEEEQDGGLIENPSDELLKKQTYGCGCFHFSKI
jgi:SAM-dependent methyltransferase